MTTRSHQIGATTTRQLQSIGIDFSHGAPQCAKLWISGAQEAFFKKGILFTSSYSKGVALTRLLKELNFTPRHIIFISDKKSHLEDAAFVEQKIPGVTFIGLRYSGADKYLELFDETSANKYFQKFIKISHD